MGAEAGGEVANFRSIDYLTMTMGKEALKLELIEWLSKLEDEDTIEYLKVVKDTSSLDKDWWNDLTAEQKKGIDRGLKDAEEGRVTPHKDVMKKYGL